MNFPHRTLNWKHRLTGRVARNVYFWAALLYVAFGLNKGNERLYRYGITASDWYVPVMGCMLVLQGALLYGNNGVLAPRFLARRRWGIYAVGALVLATAVSVLTVALFKAAKPHLNVEELQHVGFTATPISLTWGETTFTEEIPTFLFSNLLWLLQFTLAWYTADYVRQQRLLRQSEAARTRAELAFLKSQLNPHFLFNTLNNIYGLALQKSEEAPEAILKLSALLRYLLYESSETSVSFQKEQAAIEAYVEIEALRLPEHAAVSLDVGADGHYALPPLLWMPLLENAFKHGTPFTDGLITIDFRFKIEKGILTVRSQNRFNAAPAGAPAAGIGLSNLRRRLDLLFPNRYSLQCSEEKSTITYLLIIPLS